MPFINCAEGTLASYSPSPDKPWTIKRAQHLLRRIQLGADFETIQKLLDQSPESVVTQIIDDAYNLPLTLEPAWAYWQLNDYESDPQARQEQIVAQIIGWGTQWTSDIKNNGLRDRMSFFWHNHFVTRLEDYHCPSWMYQYHKLLQKYALGNFKELVREIGITPAMLVFLNGVQNTHVEPNENYARELYELFTLGVDNGYTQDDIVDTARALSGWQGLDVENLCGEVQFLTFLWDDSAKTIFGKTGNWGYDDVIDLLFEERAVQISEYICGKLYRHFVNPVEDEQMISDLALIFRNNNFEIKPVLESLFKSDHFFEDANIATVIPGHLEYMIMFLTEIGYADDYELLYFLSLSASQNDQRIFNPTDVSGWPGNRSWISSSSLSYRWQAIQNLMGFYYQLNGESFDELQHLALNIAGDDIDDPAIITKKIIDYILPKGLQNQIEYYDATAAFKGEVPENYFESGQWNLYWEYAPIQVYILLNHIANLPEFQLK